jgi:hypothetical protein
MAESVENSVPDNCIPSPESPENRTVTCLMSVTTVVADIFSFWLLCIKRPRWANSYKFKFNVNKLRQEPTIAPDVSNHNSSLT